MQSVQSDSSPGCYLGLWVDLAVKCILNTMGLLQFCPVLTGQNRAVLSGWLAGFSDTSCARTMTWLLF